MAVEEIELRLTVDGRPAQKALEDTRKQAESLGGRVGNLGEAFKSFQQKLGPSAAAISGVASALGQTNGEAGKALAAAGQVAAAFAAGGPFGAALAAGTYAVDELARSWERQIKAQDAAIQKQYSTFDALAKTTQELYKQNEALRLQVEPLSPAEIRSQARAEMAKLDAEIQKRQNAIFAAEVNRMRNRFGVDVKALEAETKQLEKQKALIFEQADLRARILEGRGPTGGAPATVGEGRFSGPALQARIVAGIAKQQEAEAKVREAYTNRSVNMWERSAKIWEAQEQQKTAILEVEEAKRVAIAQEATEARFAAEQKFVDMFGELVQQSTVNSISATQDYLDAKITGEEDAEIKLLASFLRTQGQMLVGVGTRGLFEGALLATNPVTAPQGVAMMAIGGAAVAQGVAMGAAGTAISHVAAGGTIGQALPSESTSGRSSDPGARARPSSGRMGGDSGGQAITIIYGGISGPSADDGARALRRASRRADKRGFA